MIADPGSAPPRADLTFLRHRARPRVAAPVPAQSDDAVRAAIADFIAGRGKHPARASRPPDPAPSSGSISFERPDRARRPVTTPPASAPPAAANPPTPPAAARPSSPLDLDATPGAPATSAVRRKPTRPTVRPPSGLRVRAGQQQLLSVKDPTAVLTRLQSGIGLLSIEAVCSADVGDLRLGAAYQLRSGHTSTVQLSGGNRYAPSSRRPVIVSGRDEFEHLRVDLRQLRDLERVAVYAFSESRAELEWGGTLVITTFGGGRIELPLEALYRGRVAVLISLYNVDGELLIRAEMETIAGDVREAARAYGYNRITWRDDRTPVD